MCTLTIVPTESGYLAAMNRDELRARPLALPDLFIGHENVRFLSPREASGGTWIASNERGDLLALLNWNLGAWPGSSASPISRGMVIPQLIAATDAAPKEKNIKQLPLESLAPFRLIGVSWEERTILEGRWDGEKIEVLTFPWARGHWFSSSLSDERAARERGATSELAAKQWPVGTSWLRRLHRSHAPCAGAFSICVHRPEAATVSYTEVHMERNRVTMSYLTGNPCQKEEFDAQSSLVTVRPRSFALAS